MLSVVLAFRLEKPQKARPDPRIYSGKTSGSDTGAAWAGYDPEAANAFALLAAKRRQLGGSRTSGGTNQAQALDLQAWPDGRFQDYMEGSSSIPLVLRGNKPIRRQLPESPTSSTYKDLTRQAFDDPSGADVLVLDNYTAIKGLPPSEIVAVKNPNQLRSPWAAFDPARAHEADILAGMIPAGLLLAPDQGNKTVAPDDNTALDRAVAMGFDPDELAYHGMAGKLEGGGFAPKEHSGKTSGTDTGALSMALEPEPANSFAERAAYARENSLRGSTGHKDGELRMPELRRWLPGQFDPGKTPGAAVVPLRRRSLQELKVELPPSPDWDEIGPWVQKTFSSPAGPDSILFDNYTAVNGLPPSKIVMLKNPNQARSSWAAFDPARAHEADILAGVIPAGLLLAPDQGNRTAAPGGFLAFPPSLPRE